jgi:hypothetical protein
MSQKTNEELQEMIEDLQKQVHDGIAGLANRVKRLEDYVRTVRKTLAKHGIKAPPF